jgi:hypothetical protein
MFKSSPPFGIWSIWPELGLLYKVLFEGLCAITIYFASSSFTAIMRFRVALAKQDIAYVKQVLIRLREKTERLRQVMTAAFYLFGFLLFLGLQGAYETVDKSKETLSEIVTRNLMIHFAFAANVFFLFLFLHLIQWGLCLWVDRRYSQLDVW